MAEDATLGNAGADEKNIGDTVLERLPRDRRATPHAAG